MRIHMAKYLVSAALLGLATDVLADKPNLDDLRIVRQLLGASWTALAESDAFSFTVVMWVELDPDSVSEDFARSDRWKRAAARARNPALYNLTFAQPNRLHWSLITGGFFEALGEQSRQMGVNSVIGEEAATFVLETTLAPEAFAASDGETLYIVRADRYAAIPAPSDLAATLSPSLWGRYDHFNPLKHAVGLLYRARQGLAGGQMPELVGEEMLGNRAVIRVQGPLGLLRTDPRAPRDTPTRVIAWLDAEPPHLPVRMHVLSSEMSPQSRESFEQHLPPHMPDWMCEMTFVRTIQVIEFHNWNLQPDVENIDFTFEPDEDMQEVDSVDHLQFRAEDRQEFFERFEELRQDKRGNEHEGDR